VFIIGIENNVTPENSIYFSGGNAHQFEQTQDFNSATKFADYRTAAFVVSDLRDPRWRIIDVK
jgi:hypothetical protein